MRILVTGGDGFIGRNLRVWLGELGFHDVVSVRAEDGAGVLAEALESADFVFHLAGVNRPSDPSNFDSGNRGLTETVCRLLRGRDRAVPLVFTSSIQATFPNAYGVSKLGAEREVERYSADTGAPVQIFRLPNVFGKWCRPNYNSVVATFSHNVARGLPIAVHDAGARLDLVYIDDVVAAMVSTIASTDACVSWPAVGPVHSTTVGEVATLMQSFADCRRTTQIDRVGTGLIRALYATFQSFMPPTDLSFPLLRHEDPRGMFAEVLKTPDCGQISVFTAPPGVTRGGHYHHTKCERFLVVSGRARFRLRHTVTDEVHSIAVAASESRVVQAVPGWAHDITNIGSDELIVLLWANEVFDQSRPDTFSAVAHGDAPASRALPGRNQ